jgi:tyrosinase
LMHPATYPSEPQDPEYRNGAHRGPVFLPWHREFLLNVEADLRSINKGLFIPYWDWTADATLKDPHKAVVWSEDFMGGNGVESDDWRVGNGPFAFKTGNWPIPKEHGGPALQRRFGFEVNPLPAAEDVALALAETLYDTPNYNSSPFTTGFRNRLEGWITKRGDYRVKTEGSQLHNRVHLWVGGSMLPMTSPNDPVFFLHHCNVDRIWAIWQAQQRQDNPDGAPHYAPLRDGPPGHNLHDVLKPWTQTVEDVLDISKLGYSYEEPSTHARLMDFVAKLAPVSPFSADRSPFAAH